jgi:hypothetical protein
LQVPRAIVTTAVEVVWFPKASVMLTRTAGEMATPAAVVLGWVEKASRDAAPGRMVKAVDTTPGSTPEEAPRVYPPPAWLMFRSGKEATPAAAVWVSVPCRVPPAGLLARATVTLLLAPVTLPSASTIATCTAGAMGEPALASAGCCWNTSAAGGPAVTSKAALMAGVSAPEEARSV